MTSEASPKEFTGLLDASDPRKIKHMRKTVKLIMDGLSEYSYKFNFDPEVFVKIDTYIMEQRELNEKFMKDVETHRDDGTICHSEDEDEFRPYNLDDRTCAFHYYRERRDYNIVLQKFHSYVNTHFPVNYITYKCIRAYISFVNYVLNDMLMEDDGFWKLNSFECQAYLIKIIRICSNSFIQYNVSNVWGPNEEQISITRIKLLSILLASLILYINIYINYSKHEIELKWKFLYISNSRAIKIDEMRASCVYKEEYILVEKIGYYINMCKPRPLQDAFIRYVALGAPEVSEVPK
jgi:hypothetical protein